VSKPSASKRRIYCFCAIPVCAVLAFALIALSSRYHRAAYTKSSSSVTSRPSTISPAVRERLQASFASLPLAFEQNQGQTDPQVKYMARANGYTLFLTSQDAVFSFHSKSFANARPSRSRVPQLQVNAAPSISEKPAVVRMQLVGANSSTHITAAEQLPGKSNYYLGNDPRKWQTNVSQYARVAYKSVYPGIDLAYYGKQSKLEFDFIVAPASDPASIDLAFSGAQHVATYASGNLIVSSAAGDVVLHKPVAYQQENGSRQLVDARFVVKGKNQVSFDLGSYDRSRELVIDPTVTYSTYFGGSAEDEAYGVAVDSSGNAYVTGATKSPNFPGPLAAGTNFDVFVSKLNPAGSALLYSTFVGGNAGNGDNFGLGIAVNSTGTYVIGNTSSTNFPASVTIGPGGGTDVFVAKLDNSTGVASQLTKIGGTGNDSGNGIAVDSTGAAYIGGETYSTDFPIAGPPIQTSNAGADDGFIAKLDSNGTVLDYSTYIGGSSGDLVTGIALDSLNNAYVSGITVSSDFPTTTGAFQTTEPSTTSDNGFVAAIKADGSAKIYSTYLGGSGNNDALAIAADSAGEAYVTGDTNSSNFPVLNATQATLKGASATNVFITKLQANGSGLLFSTYYGGTLNDAGTGIAIDAFNDVYVTGRTLSSDYPTNGTPFQSSLSGTSDAFVTELSNTGSPVYSSFLGGTGNENSVNVSTVLASAPLGAVAVDSASNAYLAGSTDSTTGFPVSPSALQSSFGGGLADGFVTKVGAAPADFSVAVSPATISVASGQTTATITVTVSSVSAAYNNAVTLSCGGKPSKAACNFSTLSVTPGSSPVTSNLTISTNGTTGNGLLTPPMGHRSVFYAMLLPICGLAFLGAGFGYRDKKYLGIIALTLTLALLIVLPACGGGSSGGGGGGGGGGNNTASGTYSLMVSGAAGGVTRSAPLTLTVN
jgi:beta-propeller repeat-containing protein